MSTTDRQGGDIINNITIQKKKKKKKKKKRKKEREKNPQGQ
jgi:hypothetical protein